MDRQFRSRLMKPYVAPPPGSRAEPPGPTAVAARDCGRAVRKTPGIRSYGQTVPEPPHETLRRAAARKPRGAAGPDRGGCTRLWPRCKEDPWDTVLWTDSSGAAS